MKKIVLCLLLAAIALLCGAALAEGYPESAHPYPENSDQTWTYTHPTPVAALSITFSEDTFFESYYDYLYVIDEAGVEYEYTEDQLAGKTLNLHGDSFSLRLTSDYTVNEYGFAITKIVGYTEAELEAAVPTFEISASGTITGYSGGMFKLDIPAEIDGVKVTAIDEYVFASSNFTSVTLPEGLRNIGGYAFDRSAVQTIKLPSTLETIGEGVFGYCINLTEIVLPEGLESIGDYAFYKCDSLEKVKLPSTLMELGTCAFQNCGNLQTLTVPEGISNFLSFEECHSLTKLEYLGTITDTYLPDGCFRECFALAEFDIPEGVEAIGEYAFEFCTALKQITLPSTLKNLQWCAFRRTGLVQIDIPDSVEFIDGYVFSDCENLVSISLPEGIQSIPYEVFCNCSSLKNVVIPEGVQTIEERAFRNCTALKEISLPSTLTQIDDYAFYGCASLSQIVLPEGLLSIGLASFAGCNSLDYLTIPASVNQIFGDAFHSNTCLIVSTDYAEQHAVKNNQSYIRLSEDAPVLESVSDAPAQSGVGATLTWTARAMGGSGSLSYAYDLYRNGSLYQQSGWTSSESYSHTFEKAGIYWLCVRVRDDANHESETLTSSRVQVLATNSAAPEIYDVQLLSDDEISVSAPINFSFRVRGGAGEYKLDPTVLKNDYSTLDYLHLDYTTVNMGDHVYCKGFVVPSKNGKYGLQVSAIDGSGEIATATVFNGVSVADTELRIISISGLSDNRKYTINNTNAPVVITVNTNSDSDKLRYSWIFRRADASGEVVDQLLTDSPTLEYCLKVDGDMELVVRAFDPERSIYSNARTVSFYVYPMEDSDEVLWGVDANVYGVCSVNSTFKWYPYYNDALEGSYSFSFDIYKDGVLCHQSGWIDSEDYSFTPEETGSYMAKVSLKVGDDVHGPVDSDPISVVENCLGIDDEESDAYLDLYQHYTDGAEQQYCWEAGYYVPATPARCWDLYLNGELIYTSGWYFSDSEGEAYEITTGRLSDGAGVYQMYITFRDKDGNESSPIPFEPVAVGAPEIASLAHSSFNSILYSGDLYSVSCSAYRGVGDLKVQYTLSKDDKTYRTSSWLPMTAANSQSKPAASWYQTLTEAGEYTLTATVKDSIGVSVSETLEQKIVVLPAGDSSAPEIEYISVDETEVKAGEKAVWTVNAHGGDSPLAYIFTLNADGQILGKFRQSSEVFSYRLSQASQYSVSVTVEDAQGRRSAAMDGPAVLVTGENKALVESITPSAALVYAEKGDAFLPEWKIYPIDAEPKLNFSSSNTAVATVNEAGVITVCGDGKAVITASAADESGIQAMLTVCGGKLNLLKLPANLTVVSEDAFLSIPSDALALRTGCSIGENAFRGSDLKCVYLPDDPNAFDKIARSAFADCDALVFFCQDRQSGKQADFCIENGYAYVYAIAS